MSEVQAPENNSLDPRWIALRVSKINLGLIVLGALLAFPVMWWVDGLPPWVRISLLLAFAISMAWDLRHILLKARDSVEAFYLFDLDRIAPRTAEGSQIAKTDTASNKLGIRVRFAKAAKQAAAVEHEGTVLPKAFVSPWFSALRYRLPGDPAWRRYWPRVIPLWPDGLDAAEFRKVRVMLKWK
jgi:hypothetical protein